MVWKVEEYDNAISERSIRVISDDGETICSNEPYYPTPLDPKHARLIAAAPAMLEACRKAKQLSSIAVDWNLEEVEIDGEMVATRDLEDEFDRAIAAAESQP